MTWVTYENDRIIDLQGRCELIMGSYRIVYNENRRCRLPYDGAKIYDLENEDDCRNLAAGFIEELENNGVSLHFSEYHAVYSLLKRNTSVEAFIERYGEHGEHGERFYEQLGKRHCVTSEGEKRISSGRFYDFDKITDCFTIELFGHRQCDNIPGRTVLFITTNKGAWEQAVTKLRSDLGTIPLYDFGGKPSDHELSSILFKMDNCKWDDIKF